MYLSCFAWTIGHSLDHQWPTAGTDLLRLVPTYECFQGSASKLLSSKLSQAFVGKTTDCLVAVDCHLPMDSVCKRFGSCSRLKCEKVGEQLSEKKIVQSTFKLRERWTGRIICQPILNPLEPIRITFPMT